MSSKKEPAKPSKPRATATKAEPTSSDISLADSHVTPPHPGLVPKLRFPEFREAKPWEEKNLGNEGELLSSLTGKAGPDFDAGEARFVTYMNVFSNTFVDPSALRFVDVKQGEKQNAVACGDVFFTISSETPEEVGMSSVLLEDLENCYLNSFCSLFRFSEGKSPNPVFTGYLLRQPLVRAYFTRKAQGSTRFNLSKDAFRSLPIFVPTLPEQQKIASCLSSLDELLAAQARKLEALRTHKKALMQQLFPRDGETTPQLRFPEFQDAGDWAPTTLGSVARLRNGYAFKSFDYVTDGPYQIITIANVQQGQLSLESTKRISTIPLDIQEHQVLSLGEILISMTGNVGRVCVVTTENLLLNQRVGKLVPEQIEEAFFYQLLQRAEFRSTMQLKAAGGAQGNLSSGDITEYAFCTPTDTAEQHRIAACLSSLDDLITAQTQKLAALRTHKKALMQQLFPSPEEVTP